METANHELDTALRILREQRNVDFAGYKRPLLRRRLEGRALRRHCRRWADYFDILAREPQEVAALMETLRLKVTEFFRDPETWAFLQSQVLPALLERRSNERRFVAWSAGCSTGQEAYSLIMAIAEILGADFPSWTLAISATNADEVALAGARVGTYAPRSLKGLSRERIRKWMEPRAGGAYQVRPELRDRVRFAVHDLFGDPPVSEADLVLCRNVIMFLVPDAQRRVLMQLHKSLDPDGILVLGSAEWVPAVLEGFDVVDAKHHVFRAGRRGARDVGIHHGTVTS